MIDKTIILKDGRRLGYCEIGDPKGKPILFFHGWPGSRLHAYYLEDLVKKQNIRLISIDRPGYGLSGSYLGRRLLDWPDDVVELADQLGLKKFAVMGVSGGGPYAAVCAYKIPHRLTKVGIIVGLAPITIPGILEGMGWINKLGWSNYPRLPLLQDLAALLRWMEAKLLPTNKVRQEAFRQGFKPAAEDLRIYSLDWGFDLKEIRAKVYLWYGEEDKNVSLAMGRYLKGKIRGSVLKIYPDEGHLLQVTHATEILKTLAA